MHARVGTFTRLHENNFTKHIQIHETCERVLYFQSETFLFHNIYIICDICQSVLVQIFENLLKIVDS